MLHPVSDLRNKFNEIEKTVQEGTPIYLTKNGYGTMVVLSLEQYTALNGGSSCSLW
ncbi:type II toxin-antitoxin system prevent-host-death family antitoxin [Murdochiella vaginalis]|uniref:type II toxin-antitoxin system prevent-host-death family antitoxin n=1 Tax=Murdochiella vaginalis TaxID=1852373 RepID=UPI0009F38A8C|nr:type II toxin-antitoxin system prevent-host-death family antitoxin [Murdochiella vaginalis]